jgi:excinuclease ABC subunit A
VGSKIARKTGKECITAPADCACVEIRGARQNNLKGIDIDLPLGKLTVITGPSGSGKSSLVEGTLLPAMRDAIAARGRPIAPRPHLRAIEGTALVDKIVAIDQAPLGRTPRSSAATYTGVMPKLREIFAALPEAKARGYRAGRFSTNVKGGRCEACKGCGLSRVGMAFLPDAWVVCGECEGARFDRETLQIRFKGKSISDVLSMSVDDAHALFESIPPVREPLAAMRVLGLGYLPLGQSATTLSGGEAQRVRLARELARRATGSTLYVLDEPTTGLHAVDVALLLDALVALRDQGNSIVVVEHDLDLVARADWLVDLGPGGGREGGEIVASGPPETLSRGVTAKYLRAITKR